MPKALERCLEMNEQKKRDRCFGILMMRSRSTDQADCVPLFRPDSAHEYKSSSSSRPCVQGVLVPCECRTPPPADALRNDAERYDSPLVCEFLPQTLLA